MKKIIALISIFIIFTISSKACTTAVISGKYTKDGKPMLFKNRDTWALDNSMKYFNLKPYSFIGLINSNDPNGNSIWIGSNETGFAIMNSASYNLNVDDTLTQSGLEGRLMKKALQYCHTINDFQNLLDTLPKPYLLEANFGVIDAQGGAAYFELGNHKYIKIDANDPSVAPYGYIIRTNFSFTGKIGVGGGYIRYQTTEKLLYNAVSTNNLDVKYVIQKVFRSLENTLSNTNLENFGHLNQTNNKIYPFTDFIPRYSTSSAVLVQGVKTSESPLLATIWSVVGFPLTSLAIPLWLEGGDNLPEIVAYNADIKNSPICKASLSFKEKCFPSVFGKNEANYINVTKLLNSDNSGYIQKITSIENKILEETFAFQQKLAGKKTNKQDINEFYLWLNSYTKEQYKTNFDYWL
jgi:hypothetical protein